jgi:hypothetical protein
VSQPAVGRIVHVFVEPALNNHADVAPAIITRVWSDELVNLRVLVDGKSDALWYTSVALFADRESAEQTTNYRIASDGAHVPAAAFWPPRV